MASYLIAANYHKVALPADWKASSENFDPMRFPEGVVLGFRAIFWKAFTSVHRLPVEGKLTLLGLEWSVKDLIVLKSMDAKGRLGLSDDDLIFVIMRIECAAAAADYRLNDELFKAGMNEQDFVEALVSGLSANPSLQWMTSLSHKREFPGRYIMSDDEKAYGSGPETLAMFGFHYYGLLLFWQIARDQVEIPLSSGGRMLSTEGAELLSLRKRIINLDRLFLTSSISNHPQLKALSRECKKRQNIQTRFMRLPELNERIERYFDIANQLSAGRSQRTLNAIVMVIAFLGLPVSFMSMMLTMSSRAEILVKPVNLFGNVSVQLFLLSSMLGCFMLALLLGAVFGSGVLGDLWRWACLKAARRQS